MTGDLGGYVIERGVGIGDNCQLAAVQQRALDLKCRRVE
jgi:hypothetical protein